jgi:predicted membrane-bound spermidine synthase
MTAISAAVFFASGFAALLYQVIWQRLLVLFSGADLYSVTIIVASFMGGMGVGHLAGGHVADRVTARGALLLFAVSELSIALFGFFSRPLYYDFLYNRIGDTQIGPAALALLLFASLLWPTFFMGASLPLLSRALASRLDRAARVIGLLYGVNTLGAAVGALLSTWVLLPRFGLDGSLRIGVALNVACAVVILPAVAWFSRGPEVRLKPDTTDSVRDSVRVTPVVPTHESVGSGFSRSQDSRTSFPFTVWALIFACSGLLALALEIVWFRVLSVTIKSGAFTFGTLLGVYLAGLGAGALIGSVIAPRMRRPDVNFLLLESAVGAIALLLLTAFVRLVDDVPPLHSHLARFEPFSVRAAIAGEVPTALFAVLYAGLPLLLVLPPTLLMGVSFSVLQRVVQTRLTHIGRRVGTLLVANIAGSMLGTVLTGWLLLDRVGTAGTMRLLGAFSALFAVLGATLALRGGRLPVWRVPALGTAVIAAAVVFLPLIAVMPSSGTLWAHLHGTVVEAMLDAEDGSGLSVINTDGKAAVFYANGIGQGVMPYGDVHTALGALPAFMHPAPRVAAVIGLGSGDTVHAVAGRRDIERIACIEIIRGELSTLSALRRRFPYTGLTAVLDDPRIEMIFGDGRIYLRRSGRYDIIEADALWPASAYSGTLYSDAYFALVRDHLAPGGLAATWVPTQRVYNTFIRTFPHVVAMPGILVGSNDPIPLDRAAIAARIADAADHFGRAGIDIARLLDGYLSNPIVYGPDYPRQQLADINTDLFPRDEFDLSAPR